MNTNIKTWVGALIIIVAATAVGGFVMLYGVSCCQNYSTNISPINKKNIQRACTEEAKLCPDGSYVSRTGPKCEFTPCPETVGIEDKIIITAPAKDAVISSPVAVSGRARGTWFFEGSFPVEIYDANDKLLGQGIASFIPSVEEPEWMTENFINFSGSIKFSNTAATSGYILFKKDNPSDMRELDESFKLPIKFLVTAPGNKNLSQAEKCYARINSYMDNIKNEGMANPASMFCSCMGGQAGTDTHADGGQTATCKIDGKTRDAWEYFREMNPNSNL